MDLNYIRKLVRLLQDSAVDEIEIEEEGRKIRVAKNTHPGTIPQVQFTPLAAPPPPLPIIPAPQASAPDAGNQPAPAVLPSRLHEIKSPIVGTFYRAPAPDAAPFVQVGTVVRPGVVLCIVEAMKLMNEIEADVEGKIVKIMVENGQPVEYDQTLFVLEKS
jgi:acetyl-CoA carboxylase biotin carboxyl carrier protein